MGERGPGRWSVGLGGLSVPAGVPAVLLDGLLDWQVELFGELWGPGTTGLVVPRQNGKTELLVRRAMAGAMLGEDVVWTAHDLVATRDAMGRVLEIAEGDPGLKRRVAVVRRHTSMAMVGFRPAGRIVFRTRTLTGMRGLGGVATLILDEAFRLTDMVLASIAPTQLTVPDARTLVASSPGLSDSLWLWSLRRRALAGDESLRWVEWTGERVRLGEDGRVERVLPDPADEGVWEATNPAFGRLIRRESLARARSMMPEPLFLREHLGVWDLLEGTLGSAAFDGDGWADLVAPAPTAPDRLVFAFDVSPKGRAAIVAASAVGDTVHLEVVDERDHAAWLSARMVELVGRHSPSMVAWCDWGATAGLGQVVEGALRAAGCEVTCRPVRRSAWDRGVQSLAVGIRERLVLHAGQPALTRPLLALSRVERQQGWTVDLAGCDDPHSHVACAAIAAWVVAPATAAAKAPVFAW